MPARDVASWDFDAYTTPAIARSEPCVGIQCVSTKMVYAEVQASV